MPEEVNEKEILRRAQMQALVKIGEIVLPWVTPGALRGDGVTLMEIKNSNVQSVHAQISREGNRLIVEILPRAREPRNDVAVIPPNEIMRMSLVETEQVEEPPDGPTERQDRLEEA